MIQATESVVLLHPSCPHKYRKSLKRGSCDQVINFSNIGRPELWINVEFLGCCVCHCGSFGANPDFRRSFVAMSSYLMAFKAQLGVKRSGPGHV